MNSDTFAGTASRRDSLLTAGGAGLAAALSGVFAAAAKGKHGKKKCKDKCKAQVGQCVMATTLICQQTPDPDACEEKFLPCCDHLATCNAGALLTCQNT